MKTKIRYQLASNILAIGMSVIAVPCMALDLGGIAKQVQQAIQKQEPAPAQQPAPAQKPQAAPQEKTEASQDAPGDPHSTKIKQYRRQDQSADDFMKESKQRKQKEAEELEARKESAMVPDFAETNTTLEIKGIRIGMTLKEYLAIFPNSKVMSVLIRLLPSTTIDSVS